MTQAQHINTLVRTLLATASCDSGHATCALALAVLEVADAIRAIADKEPDELPKLK